MNLSSCCLNNLARDFFSFKENNRILLERASREVDLKPCKGNKNAKKPNHKRSNCTM